MAGNDNPGFLSKVARFVRNPLTNWGELDGVEAEKENTYSQAALKEMIERKRRNDFVRRREFDQLRKLRSRGGPVGPEAVDRPSFFQSSVPPSTSDVRAGTLRKIDEIEAQMAQQWWKGKPGAAGNSAGAQLHPASGGEGLQRPVGGFAAPGPAIAPTVPAGLFPGGAAPQSRTHQATEPLPVAQEPQQAEPWQHLAQPTSDAGAAPDAQPSIGGSGFVHDPELEEAAIRFANGDYEGAEAALLHQIAPGGAGVDQSQTWLTLFDLYRAIGRHDRFDSIAIDFARRFGSSAPVWFEMTEPQEGPAVRNAGPPTTRGFNWTAPEELLGKTVSALNSALATAPRPWRLNWSRLSSIDESALDPLLQTVQQWCAQPVELRFVGAARLLQLLAESTPTGEASVDPRHWRLRMEVLRLMGQVDDFDLAALDFCITYEVSPPSWTDPECSYLEVDVNGAIVMPLNSAASGAAAVPEDSGMSTLPASLSTTSGLLDPTAQPLELAGHLVGDASEAVLAKLEQDSSNVRSLTIRCDRLARVDFSAAGSVLNWAAARHADGCSIEFNNVQRLIAVFFNVIGINEYVRVVARRN